VAAYRHAEDQIRQNYCSHRGKDGSSPRQRAQRVGAVGPPEHLACFHNKGKDAILGLQTSPGHCTDACIDGLSNSGGSEGMESAHQAPRRDGPTSKGSSPTVSESTAEGDEAQLPHIDFQLSEDPTSCENYTPSEQGLLGASPMEALPTAHSLAGCSVRSGVSPRKSFGLSQDGMYKRQSTCTSFQGKLDLLRATSSSTVMSCGASIFAASSGSAATYALSREVSQIQVFISHNWAVSRVKKFFCLTLYFNFHTAFLTALAVMIAMAVATDTGHLPLERDLFDWGQETNTGMCGTLLVMPIFLFVAFVAHEVRSWLRFGGPTVFLDKTCIHQEDADLQRAAILKLGAFLKQSSDMFVIYTDMYLTKLWTVYEVACFLSHHPTDRMIMMPIHAPMIVYVGMIMFYLTAVLDLMIQVYTGNKEVVYIMYMFGTLGVGWALRCWAREKVQIHRRLHGFEVQKCKCFCEDDRPLVYNNIASLMRNTGRVAESATMEDGLHAFNQMVRERLPDALTASVGPVGISYLHVVSIFMFTSTTRHLDFRLGWPDFNRKMAVDDYVRMYITWTLYECVWTFGVLPLLFAFMSRWSGLRLHWTHARGAAWLVFGTLLQTSMFVIMDLPLTMLTEWAEGGSVIGMIALVCTFLSTTCVALVVFKRRRRFLWQQDEWNDTDDVAEATEEIVAESVERATIAVV